MSPRLRALLLALMAAAPFGEGGRAPLALLILHTIVILVGVIAAGRLAREGGAAFGGGRRSLVVLVASGLTLAAVSAWRADYAFAAGLGLWDLTVACILFLATLASGASRTDLAVLRAATVAATGVQAIAALALLPSGGPPAAARFFLNSDHLAAFLNFGLLLAASAALEAARAGRRRAALLWGGAAALHLAATLPLASRGGLLGLSAGLLLLACARLGVLAPAARRAAVLTLIVVLLSGGALAWRRFARVPDPYRYARLTIWRAALGMLAERPLLGFGPGMLPHEGPRHNLPGEHGPFRFEKMFTGAHSIPLSLAVECGAPAALGFVAAAILAVGLLLRAAPPWPGGGETARAVGIALVPLLTQGLVEDLQQRPALVLIPAALAGAALAAMRRSSGEAAVAPRRAPDRSGLRLPAVLARVGVVYLFAIAVALPYLADREARAALAEGRAGLARMERAARLNPLQPEYRHDLAMAALNEGPLTPERYARAVTRLLEARRLTPREARYPLVLGRLEALAARTLFRDPALEERAVDDYRAAVRLAPVDPRPRLELAGHLADQDRPAEALPLLQEALALEPRFVRARLLLAAVQLRLGRRDAALEAYREAGRTLEELRDVPLDSGYARDLAQDVPAERARLEAELGAARGEAPGVPPPAAPGPRQSVDNGGEGTYIAIPQVLEGVKDGALG